MPAEPTLSIRPPAVPLAKPPIHQEAEGRAPPAVEPLLVPAAEAARLCGISEATWYRLKSAGKLPLPVRLASRVLWKAEELRRWCAAGCPELRTWQALENVNGRRNGTAGR